MPELLNRARGICLRGAIACGRLAYATSHHAPLCSLHFFEELGQMELARRTCGQVMLSLREAQYGDEIFGQTADLVRVALEELQDHLGLGTTGITPPSTRVAARAALVSFFAFFASAALAQDVSLVGGAPPVQTFDSLPATGTGVAGVPALVRSIEYLGADAVVRCAIGDETLTVRTAGAYDGAVGSPVHLCWPAAQAHWFGTDERRIDG